MLYQRYFKNGQRLLLKALETENNGRTDLLTVYMDGGSSGTFVLTLPYSDDATEQYPFSEGMLFELSSEILGMGIRVTGTFHEKIDGKRIALQIRPDLQMFQRRGAPRLDCKLGIRFTRGQGALKALRSTWEKNIQILHSPNAPLNLEGFKPCQVNLSSGGIRFALRPPVNLAELCLMLITVIVSGMRFINILESDQMRINKFIAEHKTTT